MKFPSKCTILILLCCLANKIQSTSATLEWLANIFGHGHNSFGVGGGGYGYGYGNGGYNGGGGFGSSLLGRFPWLMQKGKELFGGGRYPSASGSGWYGGGGGHTSAGYYGGNVGQFRHGKPWLGHANNYYGNRLQYNRNGGHIFLR